MADIDFSDLSKQAITAATKILCESNTTPNELKYDDGDGLITWIKSQGYLTETEILALTTLITSSDFNINSVIQKNGAGVMVSTLITALETAYPKLLKEGFEITPSTSIAILEGRAYNFNVSAFNKSWAVFVEGTGNGCLNSASLVASRMYFVFLINKDSAPTTYDYFADIDIAGANIPSGWTEVFMIGTFQTNGSSVVASGSTVKLKELLASDHNGFPFMKDYFSNFTLVKFDDIRVTIGPCETRDSTDTYNQRSFSDTHIGPSGIAASTVYYIFQTSEKGADVTFEFDTDINGSGLSGTNFRLIGLFETDESSVIITGSVFSIINDREDYVVLPFSMPLTGVTASEFMLIGEERIISAGETGNYTTDFAVSGWNVAFLINSITTGGTITITGTSINKHTGAITVADTEAITIDTSLSTYRSLKRFYEVTDITLSGIVGIDYDILVCGCETGLGTNYEVLGYVVDMMSSGVNPDINIQLYKIDMAVDNKITFTDMENIGIDSGAIGSQITDNIRTGADDRTNNPAVADIWGTTTKFRLEQRDFASYFTSDENIIYGSSEGGFKVKLSGSPTGGLSAVDFIILTLYIKTLKVLNP